MVLGLKNVCVKNRNEAQVENQFTTGCEKSIGPPCHTKFDLFSIVLGKSDETMPYRLDLGNSFGVVYIAVTYLVQELC